MNYWTSSTPARHLHPPPQYWRASFSTSAKPKNKKEKQKNADKKMLTEFMATWSGCVLTYFESTGLPIALQRINTYWSGSSPCTIEDVNQTWDALRNQSRRVNSLGLLQLFGATNVPVWQEYNTRQLHTLRSNGWHTCSTWNYQVAKLRWMITHNTLK